MDDFKKLTEQLLKIYINAESVNGLDIEKYFDENISLIGTGEHEVYRNLHEFLDSFKFDVKRRGIFRYPPIYYSAGTTVGFSSFFAFVNRSLIVHYLFFADRMLD